MEMGGAVITAGGGSAAGRGIPIGRGTKMGGGSGTGGGADAAGTAMRLGNLGGACKIQVLAIGKLLKITKISTDKISISTRRKHQKLLSFATLTFYTGGIGNVRPDV